LREFAKPQMAATMLTVDYATRLCGRDSLPYWITAKSLIICMGLYPQGHLSIKLL